jgi:hypothetical protein
MSDRHYPTVLIQMDPDQHASVFDSVVAIDCGVDHVLNFGNVEPLDVRDLVHGAMFTRGGDSLRRTAIFVGGSNVQTAEQILRSVVDSFFGNIRVSVMLDANGANTTAAAAVVTLEKHLTLDNQQVAVLAATGSVGRRVAWLAARRGAAVTVVSRSYERARDVCDSLRQRDPSLRLTPIGTDDDGTDLPYDFLNDAVGIIAAGAAGIQLLPAGVIGKLPNLQIAIDLNAVPPSGMAGIQATDAEKRLGQTTVYGAIGVGNLKMKIHRRCVELLFESNDHVLDIDEIFAVGQSIATRPSPTSPPPAP